MKEVLAKETKDFIQVHRSYLINMTKIDSFQPSFVNINGHKIPIGKAFKANVILQKE